MTPRAGDEQQQRLGRRCRRQDPRSDPARVDEALRKARLAQIRPDAVKTSSFSHVHPSSSRVSRVTPRRTRYVPLLGCGRSGDGSAEHTSELQSLMRISYAVFRLKKQQSLKRKAYANYSWKAKNRN